MSTADEITEAKSEEAPAKKAEKGPLKTVFGGFGWIWSIGFILIVLGFIAWSQRFQIASQFIDRQLENIGIRAQYNITSMGQTSLSVNNVKLSHDGEVFFSADSAELKFQIDELRDGHVRDLSLINPKLEMTFDEKGKVLDSWWPKSTGTGMSFGSQADLPIAHINVQGGTMVVNSPYGSAQGWINGDFRTTDDFSLEVKVNSDSLAYKDAKASLYGNFSVARRDNVNHVSGHLELPEWFAFGISGHNIQWDGEGDLVYENNILGFGGNFKLSSLALDSDAVTMDKGDLNWDGDISWNFSGDESGSVLNGNWTLNVDNIFITDSEERRQLARDLLRFESTKKSPVLQDFIPVYLQTLNAYLSGSDIDAAGRINKTLDALEVFLDAPLKVTQGAQSLTVKPRASGSSVIYDLVNDTLRIWGDIELTGKLPVAFSNAEVRFGTFAPDTPLKLQYINGRLIITRPLVTTTFGGREARVAPMTGDFNYTRGSLEDGGAMTIVGALDFDGTLPSGYGKNVRADGQLTFNLGDNMTIGFEQKPGTHIFVGLFGNSSEWQMHDVTFDLAPSDKFYQRNRNADDIFEGELNNVTGRLTNQASQNGMDISFARVHPSGRMNGPTQNWHIEGYEATMRSDTLPAKGTFARTDQIEIDIKMSPNKGLTYTLSSDDVFAETDLFSAKNMAISGKGTTKSVSLNYDDALVKFKTIQLPVFPLTGKVKFENSAWFGDAQSYFLMAKDTPIDIQYQYKDKRGSADLLVTNLPFRRRGLQPQALVPALKGMVGDVNGDITVHAHAEFGGGQPVTSSGFARMVNMNIGTAIGPLEGVNTDISFSSFLPVVTDGRQTVRIKKFDPGIILENGEIEFEIVPNGVQIYRAAWPLGKGFISLDPTKWIYSAKENRMTLRVENVALSDFTRDFGSGRLEATGDISGVLPVVISGMNVNFDNAHLEVKDGGVFSFSSEKTDQAASQNETTQLAFDSLKNFHYESLEVWLNGPIVGGYVEIILKFLGENPDVLGGTKFKYNVKLNADLLKLINSFRMDQTIIGQVKSQYLTEPKTSVTESDNLKELGIEGSP